MAILAGHVRWYEEIFRIEGVLAEPVAMFGLQEVGIDPRWFAPWGHESLWARCLRWRLTRGVSLPDAYRVDSLVELLEARGIGDVRVVDANDPRADLRHDMNRPVPASEHGRYGTLIDIGSVEHVFDTRQCLENCVRMIRTGGTYVLHTCVRGYHLHGLHTFHPETLRDALRRNGFEILYDRLTSWDGVALRDTSEAEDVLLWLVGRKVRVVDEFVCPQQDGWAALYAPAAAVMPTSRAVLLLKRLLYPWVPPILMDLYRRARGKPRPSLVASGLRKL